MLDVCHSSTSPAQKPHINNRIYLRKNPMFTAFLHFFKLTVNTSTLLYIHVLGRGQKQGCHRLVFEGKQTPD